VAAGAMLVLLTVPLCKMVNFRPFADPESRRLDIVSQDERFCGYVLHSSKCGSSQLEVRKVWTVGKTATSGCERKRVRNVRFRFRHYVCLPLCDSMNASICCTEPTRLNVLPKRLAERRRYQEPLP